MASRALRSLAPALSSTRRPLTISRRAIPQLRHYATANEHTVRTTILLLPRPFHPLLDDRS